jgi:hypothetical protein
MRRKNVNQSRGRLEQDTLPVSSLSNQFGTYNLVTELTAYSTVQRRNDPILKNIQ